MRQLQRQGGRKLCPTKFSSSKMSMLVEQWIIRLSLLLLLCYKRIDKFASQCKKIGIVFLLSVCSAHVINVLVLVQPICTVYTTLRLGFPHHNQLMYRCSCYSNHGTDRQTPDQCFTLSAKTQPVYYEK